MIWCILYNYDYIKRCPKAVFDESSSSYWQGICEGIAIPCLQKL
jgi:hypothetical protein